MKLNYKRTILVGFAFFLICAFWQAYDTIIPKILTDKFGLPQAWSGAIMALDNVFALLLLPLFGALSDRTNTRFGKRTPFVAIGTVLAVTSLLCLSVADGAQLDRLSAISATEGEAYTEALAVIYDSNPNVRLEGEESDGKSFGEIVKGLNPFGKDTRRPLQELISREEFCAITMKDAEGNTNPQYNQYVVPARQAAAAAITEQNHGPLVAFVLLLLLVLVSMGTFRSPAVALMPDVTPKPLRSKANAIINLMGSLGGVLVLVLGMILGTGDPVNALMRYTPFFAAVGVLMLVALAVFLWRVREPQWAAEVTDKDNALDTEATPKEQEVIATAEVTDKDDAPDTEDIPKEQEVVATAGKLTPAQRISFALILASVVLWFMGYNAVTSKYSVYAGSVLNMDYNTTLLLANAAAIAAYLPIGILSSKFGRKRMILVGVGLLGAAFFAASFMRAGSPLWFMNLLFAGAGIGWATINVNSYPMVVELASKGNLGRYTGYYYTASMAAQMITPVLSGVFLDIRFTTLFPYATVFVLASFVTMLFVRHGDVTPTVDEGEVA